MHYYFYFGLRGGRRVNELQRAIYRRCSRRKYLDVPLDPTDVESLKGLIQELGGKGDRSIRLVLDNHEAFKGFRKSYGMLTGVRNYIALVGNKSDVIEVEELGYYGEWLVLQATALGLGTCWVGGTFDRRSCALDLIRGESILCVITVGYVAPKLSKREALIHRVVHRKTKLLDDMYESNVAAPNWFLAGMKAVQRAPSAVNRQPVFFTYNGGVVAASVDRISGDYNALDLGIAKLHFELGAGGGEWDFGNGAEYRRIVPQNTSP